MTKAASSPSPPKRASAAKETSSATKPRTRTAKDPNALQLPSPEPGPDLLALLTERLNALEEKITTSLSSIIAEMQALKTPAGAAAAAGEVPSETFLPVVADLIRRNLMEQITPVIAALKRLEERVGFIGNRLKHPAGGQEQRQKPWRHDQQRHARPRGHNGPRPGQGQPWAPPSAASVQGHFAPRPFRGSGEHPTPEDEET